MKKSKKLSVKERCSIYKMLRLGYSFRQIGNELGRSHTTILREVRRNAPYVCKHSESSIKAFQATKASDERTKKARNSRIRLKNNFIRNYVELHLKQAKWSPETIAGKLTCLGYKISYEAIYQWINTERPDLKSCLWIAGRSRRRRRAGKSHRQRTQPAPNKVSIELLPEEAKTRAVIGHLELDAMHGVKGGAVLQTKVDRKSRKIFLDKAHSLESKVYSDILVNRLEKLPVGILKTILNDNGAEHANFTWVDSSLKTATYFTHPYCSSERGSVENRHLFFRRFIPKGTDLETIPDDFIEWLEDYFNNKPMKVLGFKTPNQVWNEELNITARAA